MQTVNYTGRSQVRKISAAEFTSVGITQASAQWDATNSYQQIVSDAAAAYLLAQGDFVLDTGMTFTELMDSLSVGSLLTSMAVPPQVVMSDALSLRHLTPTALVYVEVDGVARKLPLPMLMSFIQGNDHPTVAFTGTTYTVIPATDVSLAPANAGAATVTLPNIPAANLPMQPIRLLANAGGVTFVAGASAILNVSPAFRAKTRVQYSIVWAVPMFNFSGQTIWTITGDTALS